MRRITPFLVFVLGASALTAQDNSGAVETRFSSSGAGTREHSVMVSIIQGTGVVDQSETVIPSGHRFNVPEGTYDVRAEGDGLVTQVKKGVHVVAGRTLNLEFIMKPGTGAVVTEYAAAVLSREEIEARLKKLESQTAELQKALQAQQAAYPIRRPD